MSRRLLAALALMPLLVMAVATPVYAMRCRTTGAMMSLCACPAPAGEVAPVDTVGGQTCCQLHKVDTVRPPSTAPATPQELLAPPEVVVAELAAPAPPTHAPRIALARPVAHGRPPLLLVKSSRQI